jgi:hypothetical protein
MINGIVSSFSVSNELERNGAQVFLGKLSSSLTKSDFDRIDWTNLKDRPPIDKGRLCKESEWWDTAKCCMSGYSVEHVLDTGRDNGFEGSAEMRFLQSYPCLNGVELDSFFERFSKELPSREAGKGGKGSFNGRTETGILNQVIGVLMGWFESWF